MNSREGGGGEEKIVEPQKLREKLMTLAVEVLSNHSGIKEAKKKEPRSFLLSQTYYEREEVDRTDESSHRTKREWFLFDMKLVMKMIQIGKTFFPLVDYGYFYVSSYPGDQVRYVTCSISKETKLREPLYKFTPKMLNEFCLRYDLPDIHKTFLYCFYLVLRSIMSINLNRLA